LTRRARAAKPPTWPQAQHSPSRSARLTDDSARGASPGRGGARPPQWHSAASALVGGDPEKAAAAARRAAAMRPSEEDLGPHVHTPHAPGTRRVLRCACARAARSARNATAQRHKILRIR
jgi:hypothetical protein